MYGHGMGTLEEHHLDVPSEKDPQNEPKKKKKRAKKRIIGLCLDCRSGHVNWALGLADTHSVPKYAVVSNT